MGRWYAYCGARALVDLNGAPPWGMLLLGTEEMRRHDTCTFFGFPGAQLLDAQNNPLPTNVVRDGGFLANEPGPSLVTVPPGGSAIFRMHWGQVPVGNETTCPTASQLEVTPPDEFDSLVVSIQIMACGGGRLDVSAVQPAS